MKNYLLQSPEWNEQQLNVLNSRPNTLVVGSAGTGKTLLALHLACKYYSDEKSVAVVVFTKSLRAFVEDFFLSQEIFGIEVFYKDEFSNVEDKEFDIMIIDEYQDFELSFILFAIQSVRLGTYIFGDDEQMLYNNRVTATSKSILAKTQYKLFKLNQNFRVPRQLVGLINNIYKHSKHVYSKPVSFEESFLQEYTKKNLNTWSRESSRVELHHFSDHLAQLTWLTDFLKSENRYENIGILLKQNDSRYNGYYFEGKFYKEMLPGILDTRKQLFDSGIDVGYKYRREDKLNFKGNRNINILTIHSAKGLEFDCVVLPFYSRTNVNFNHNLPYVAFTRSSEKLIILYSGIISEEMHLAPKEIVDGYLRKQTNKDVMPSKPEKNFDEIQAEIKKMDYFWGDF